MTRAAPAPTPGERLVREWLADQGACVEFELSDRPGLDLRGLIGRIDGAVGEAWQNGACENGHHDHKDCSEACSCVGAGQSRIEKAEEEAETAFARGREMERAEWLARAKDSNWRSLGRDELFAVFDFYREQYLVDSALRGKP